MIRPCLPRSLRTRAAALAVIAGCAAAAPAARSAATAADASAADPIVELPKYTVTDTPVRPEPESWRYARIEGFEVLSNASDKDSVRLLKKFQTFQMALGRAWPPADLRSSVPAYLVLCGSGGKFAAFEPKRDAGPDAGIVSLTLRDKDSSAIVVDMQASRLNLTNSDIVEAAVASAAAQDAASTAALAAANTAPGSGTALTLPGASDPEAGMIPQFSVDTDKQLFREYIHFILSRSEPRAAPWLEEGLAQIFMRMDVSPKLIVVGYLEDPNTVSAVAGVIEDMPFNRTLLKRSLMPMDEMFAVPADSPTALHPVGSTWASQCFAFVHYGLFGEKGYHQKAFLNFISRASTEPVTEALFKECFGEGYKDMLGDLRGYCQNTLYKTTELRPAKGARLPEPPDAVFREATQAEIGRIKGESLMMAGNRDLARSTLISPYILGERDPALLAAIGLFANSTGDTVRARKLLGAAVAAKAVRPRAYVEYARMLYDDALAAPAGPDGHFSPEQMAPILRPLFVARTQPPGTPEIYDLMADVWAKSSVPPSRKNLDAVEEGALHFYRHAELVYKIAQLDVQYGFYDDAAKLSELGLRVSPDAATRARFAALKASVPVSPATAEAAAPATTPVH